MNHPVTSKTLTSSLARAKKTLRVAVVLEANYTWHQLILTGISDYLAIHPGWTVYLTSLGDITPNVSALRKLHLHGLITGDVAGYLFEDWQQRLALASALRIPAVMTLTELKNSKLPEVAPDDLAVGKLAADHFQEQGFRHFAYYGGDMPYSRSRKKGFLAALADLGHECSVLLREEIPWGKLHEEWESNPLADWLKSLPRPTAVMACSDLWARHLVYTCERVGLRIPEDIAILGVDNQTAFCEMLPKALSSVELDPRRIGYLAAGRLAGLMAGELVNPKPTLVPPKALVLRHSTSVLTVDDPDIANAVRFIRDHAAEAITVEDVLTKIHISRRKLEVGFQRNFHRSPQKEIWRVHVERAKALLEQTSIKMERVAQQSGFSGADRMSVIFRRETGVTPRDSRENTRGL